MRNQYKIKPGDTLYSLAKKYNTTVEDILYVNPKLNPYNIEVGDMIIMPSNTKMPPTYSFSAHNISPAELELMNAMRMTWEQHVFWTRMTIISMAENLKDVDLVSARLLQNATDMGNLFRPYYGDDIANKITSLFRDHLTIAAQLITAAKNGDANAAANYEKQWYANADAIADFLSSINPYYNNQVLRTMLHEHLALTKQEAVERLSGEYAKDIATFDKIEQQALMMADYLSSGIIKVFK